MTFPNSFLLFAITFLIGCTHTEKKIDISYPKGGYDYPNPTEVTDTSFLVYPVKNLLTPRDSFRQAYYGYYWAKAFNEQNLSIKYQGSDVFRFELRSVFGKDIIITLTQNLIVVKEIVKGDCYPVEDLNNLTPLESDHLYFLNNKFPLNREITSERSQHRIDSLVKLYPELLDPKYYKYLLDKSINRETEKFEYKEKKIAIKSKKFIELVESINSSGFWKLPPQLECDIDVLDGYAFTLEANTKNKYNFVSSGNCTTTQDKFKKACQEIINCAKLDKKIRL